MDFDRGQSYEFLLYAFSAACNPRGILTWTCPYCGPRIHFYGFFGNDVNQTFGYVGFHPLNRTIIVAFRGSLVHTRARCRALTRAVAQKLCHRRRV